MYGLSRGGSLPAAGLRVVRDCRFAAASFDGDCQLGPRTAKERYSFGCCGYPDVTRLQFPDCADDANVMLYTVKGLEG